MHGLYDGRKPTKQFFHNMRKLLLLSAAALAAAPLFALEPEVVEDAQCIIVSPDGKTVGSDLYGTVIIYNLETGTKAVYQGDEYSGIGYSLGLGNCLSSTGLAVGEAFEAPCVLKADEWIELPVVHTDLTNLANGITADGLRICGSMGMARMTIDDTPTPMIVPCVWELGADGEYGEAVLLPYPALDFTGRVPQYVTANFISDDGKTIVGQVVDYTGYLPYLITYHQQDDYTWTYQVSPESMYNPNNLQFPEWPGDGPAYPELESFMTEEEIANYNAAYDAWIAECEESGNWDYSTCPVMEDFISQEGKDAYQAAMDAYEAEYETWNVQFEAFSEVFDQCEQSAHPLEFNSLALSPDGKTAGSVSLRQDFDPVTWTVTSTGGMVLFNTEDNTVTLTGENLATPTSIKADGTIFATLNSDGNPPRAVVFAPDATDYSGLEDYVRQHNPEAADWIKENMYHDMEAYDENWEPVVLEGVNCTGVPHSAGDVIISHCPNYWDYAVDTQVFSYIIPNAVGDGVKAVDMTSGFAVRAARGVVSLSETCDLRIVDAQGRTAFEAKDVNGDVNTGLASGAYVIKATRGNETKILKAMF